MQVYQNMPWLRNYMHAVQFYTDPLRWIGFTLLQWLGRLTDLGNSAITALLGINVMNISSVKSLAATISPVGWSILTVALTASGIFMMFYSGKNKELLHNLFMAVVLIVAVPFMFSELNALKDAGVSDMTALLTDNTSMGQQIIRNSVVDISNSTTGINTLPGGIDPYYLNINARLPRTSPWLYAEDTVSGNDNTGYTMIGHELGDGFFGLGKEQLYAYGFDGVDGFLFPFFTLLITFATLAFTGFKVARIIYDIAYHQLIAIPVFASDINNGHRSKKFIQSLISCFLILILVLLNLKLFLAISSWLSLNVSNIYERILALAGAAWGTIDGPDIVVHLLGVDAGIRNATNMLMGLNAFSSLAGGVIGGGISAAGSLYSGARKAVGGISAIPRLAGSFREGMGAAAGVAGAATGIKSAAAKTPPSGGGGRASSGPAGGDSAGESTTADTSAQEAAGAESSMSTGSSGDFKNYAAFDQELNRRAQGVGHFAAGQTRMANRAARLGYFHGRVETGITPASLKSPLSRAHEATHGHASESAASVTPPSQPQAAPPTPPTAQAAPPEPQMPMTAPEPPEAPAEPQSSAPVNYTPPDYDGPERASNRDIYQRQQENNAHEAEILNTPPQEPLWPGAHHGGDR